jgi:hypothetical protein
VKERIIIDVSNNLIYAEILNEHDWVIYKNVLTKFNIDFLSSVELSHKIISQSNASIVEDEVLLHVRGVIRYEFDFLNMKCEILLVEKSPENIDSFLLFTKDEKNLFLMLKWLKTFLA